MGKYKNGDRVRVKKGLRPGYKDNPIFVTHWMADQAGKCFEVEGVVREDLYMLEGGFGFAWHESFLEPVESAAQTTKWRIIMEGDENTCRAKLLNGKTVLKEASATRYHKDEHNVGTAAKALLGKMFPEEKKPEPKYFTGRAVCAEALPGLGFTVGRIHEFKDGRTAVKPSPCCESVQIPIRTYPPIESIEDLNRRFMGALKFIEIKE